MTTRILMVAGGLAAVYPNPLADILGAVMVISGVALNLLVESRKNISLSA